MSSERIRFLAAKIKESELHSSTQSIDDLLQLKEDDYLDMTKIELGLVLNIVLSELKRHRTVLELLTNTKGQ
jgi:hypothetical protein